MDEDCGCEILPGEEERGIKDFVLDPNGVGEEIFEDEDIFERVKKYYQDFSGEDLRDVDDDLMLDIKEKKDTLPISFVEDLKEALKKGKEDKISYRRLEEVEEKKPLINTFEIDDKKLINTSDKERKIKFIKNYLKKLKDGT